jgi:tRNA nucleotidyltransferase (CCA-adding enzyme)
MQTRSTNKYQKGFYRNLIQFHAQELIEDQIIPAKKQNEININHLIKEINFNVLKKLRSTRKQNPTCIIKLKIEEKIYSYLQKSFDFNNCFKKSDEFLRKFKIEEQRCQNQRYYSLATQFEFKINRGKKLKFNQLKDDKVISREITSNSTLTISFFVKNFP